MPIFTLRYKSSRASGIQFGQFEAENASRAEQAAQKWCNNEPGRQFIGLAPFLTASAIELLGPMSHEQPIEQAPIEQGEQRRGPGRPPKPVGVPAV